VIVTAILIHLTWFYNARRNVADVVGQLNRQSSDRSSMRFGGP
jgi:hypothetical protein